MKIKKQFLACTVILATLAFHFVTDTKPAFGASVNYEKLFSSASEWKFKRKIIINNAGAAATDAVIEITFDRNAFDYEKSNAAGSDIRFSTSDHFTGNGLSYWTEQWNADGLTRIWVRLPALKANQSELYLYYGNEKATSVSDGNATFLFFDDFEKNDFAKKWTNTSIGEVLVKDGQLKLKETDGQDGIVMSDFNVTGKMIVRTAYQRDGGDGHWVRAGIGGWNKWLCFGDHTDTAASGTNYVMLFDSSSITSLKTVPLIKLANSVITDQWRRAEYWYDGKNLKGKQGNVTLSVPLQNASSKLALRTLDNDSWDNFAFITVSAYPGAEPAITLGKEQNN